MQTKIPGADLRILEGIAYPLSMAKVITNLVDRGDLLNEVTDYLENVLVPYYQSNLSKLAVTSQSKQLTVQLDVVNGATCTLVKSTELAMRKEAMAEFLVVSVVVDRVKKLGGKVNKTVRINGRPTKCLTLPKTVFSKENCNS